MTFRVCCFTIGPLVAALCVATMVGCRPAARQPLIVVVSGDTNGWIAPCGCSSNQSGGLSRRATYVAELRKTAEVIVADAGGALKGNSPYDLAKFEAILAGEKGIGTIAHNIGAAEARLSPASLQQLATAAGVTLLSANVRDGSGQPIGRPIVVVPAAGRRIALIGVLGQQYATPTIRVGPPREAVLETLAQAGEKADAVIVLAYLPEQELRQLAESLPEVDAVVGGPTGQPMTPKHIGPTLLTSATRDGKFLARLDAPMEKPTWTGTIAELDGRYADDLGQVAILAGFRKRLGEHDFRPTQTGFVPPLMAALPASFTTAGSEACRNCHEADWNVWQHSKHAEAWKSLEAKGTQVDPDCQRCHTTNYGLPGGFTGLRQSTATVNVGCESCHGPSAQHSADPKMPTAYFGQAKNHCTGCHDHENSPAFAYEKYWLRIAHGKDRQSNKSPAIATSKDEK